MFFANPERPPKNVINRSHGSVCVDRKNIQLVKVKVHPLTGPESPRGGVEV
jgi:hypothetical protein